MAASKNDVTRLIESSFNYKLETALCSFPMFTPKQIREVYAMSKSARKELLEARKTDAGVPSDHHSPSQAAKIREIATDPSNR